MNQHQSESKSSKPLLSYPGIFESSGVLLLIGTGLWFVDSPWGGWLLGIGGLIGIYGFVQLVQDGNFWMDEEHAIQPTASLPVKRVRVLVGIYLGAVGALLSLGALASRWVGGVTLMLAPLLALFLLVADVVMIAQKSKWPTVSGRSNSFTEGLLRGFGMASFYAFGLAIAGGFGVGVASHMSGAKESKPAPVIPGSPNATRVPGLIKNQTNPSQQESGAINAEYWNSTVKRIPTMIRVRPEPSVRWFLKYADLNGVRSALKTDPDVDGELKDLAERFLADVTEYRKLTNRSQPPTTTNEVPGIASYGIASNRSFLLDPSPPPSSEKDKPNIGSQEKGQSGRLTFKIFSMMPWSITKRQQFDEPLGTIERARARLWLNLLEAYELRGRLQAEYPDQKFLFPWEDVGEKQPTVVEHREPSTDTNRSQNR